MYRHSEDNIHLEVKEAEERSGVKVCRGYAASSLSVFNITCTCLFSTLVGSSSTQLFLFFNL
jgi:hypothetical protein